MTYQTCPHCGANLDPEEKCNCQEEEADTAAQQKISPDAAKANQDLPNL
jgi:hypothetical protein